MHTVRRQLEGQLCAVQQPTASGSLVQQKSSPEQAFDAVASPAASESPPMPGSLVAGAAVAQERPAEPAAAAPPSGPVLQGLPLTVLVQQLSHIRAAASIQEEGERQQQAQLGTSELASTPAGPSLAGSRRVSAQAEEGGLLWPSATAAAAGALASQQPGSTQQAAPAPVVAPAAGPPALLNSPEGPVASLLAGTPAGDRLLPVPPAAAHQAHAAAVEQMLVTLDSASPEIPSGGPVGGESGAAADIRPGNFTAGSAQLLQRGGPWLQRRPGALPLGSSAGLEPEPTAAAAVAAGDGRSAAHQSFVARMIRAAQSQPVVAVPGATRWVPPKVHGFIWGVPSHMQGCKSIALLICITPPGCRSGAYSGWPASRHSHHSTSPHCCREL